ncbi:MAG: class F sortase [Jiangellaceae bacterium]
MTPEPEPSQPISELPPAATQTQGTHKAPGRHTERRAAPSPDAAKPVWLVVPDLGVDAAVVPVTSAAGVLDPPPDPQVLGWWSGGAVPGAAVGSALVAGHTVHDGGGALDHLETVRRGALVRVTTVRGAIDYTVRSVHVLNKPTLAEEAPRLFSQQVDGRLVLVTCEDWDGTGYRSNVVVTAVPTT